MNVWLQPAATEEAQSRSTGTMAGGTNSTTYPEVGSPTATLRNTSRPVDSSGLSMPRDAPVVSPRMSSY